MLSIGVLAVLLIPCPNFVLGDITPAFPDASIQGQVHQADNLFDEIFSGDNINKAMKAVVGVAIEEIVPEVGVLLGALVDALWPEPSDAGLVWSELEKDVETIASGLIAEQNTQFLRSTTEGIYNELNIYLETVNATKRKGKPMRERADTFQALLLKIEGDKPYFMNDQQPWNNLPYFAAVGTLYLAVLREQHLFYRDIWGHADYNAEQHRQDLDNAVQIWLTARDAIVNQAIQYHQSQLNIDYIKRESGYWNTNELTYSDPVRQVSESFSWSQDGADEAIGKYYFQLRQKQWETWIPTGYRAQIEALLSPSFAWPLYASDPRPGIASGSSTIIVDEGEVTNTTVRRLMLDYPGWIGDGAALGLSLDPPFYFDHSQLYQQYGPLSKIVIHGGDRIDAIEFYYGDQQAPLQGKIGGDQIQTLEVQPGEMITGLWANDAQGSLDALKLSTTDQNGATSQIIQVGRSWAVNNGWKYLFDGTDGGLQGDSAKRLLYFQGWSRTESDGGHIYRLMPVFGHYQSWGPLQ